MATEPEAVPTAEDPPRPREARPKKKKKGAARRQPRTEQEINAPTKQTLAMMGVLCGVTVVLWVLAHAACNYHPPRETRRPRAVTTEELTRDPKGAAIELVQRWTTGDFKGALEIATGSLVQDIERDKARCESDRAACDKTKAETKDAITTAVVLDRDFSTARVRVTTHRIPGAPHHYLAEVQRVGSTWKVASRVPDDGTAAPRPAASDAAASPDAASPTDSAPPPGSAASAAPAQGQGAPSAPAQPQAVGGGPALPPGHPAIGPAPKPASSAP